MSDFPNSSARYLVPVVVVLVIAFAVFSSMTVIVQSGNVGVIASLGAVQPNALPEGFHFKKPSEQTMHA
jgi:regulator of protease activity HflC (stomatin/prohibitin superfamily)